MSWWSAIAEGVNTFLIGSRQKAVNDEVWKLKEEYKTEMKELKAEVNILRKEVAEVQRAEEECQRRIVPLLKENNDLREELIFVKKQKP